MDKQTLLSNLENRMHNVSDLCVLIVKDILQYRIENPSEDEFSSRLREIEPIIRASLADITFNLDKLVKRFIIDDYDGSESVTLEEEINWLDTNVEN